MIKAPKGKVLKAYIVPTYSPNKIYHGIIDEYGDVFIRNWGGWSSSIQRSGLYKVTALPNAVERGNEWNSTSWSFSEWWRRNWLCDSWAWCYGQRV